MTGTTATLQRLYQAFITRPAGPDAVIDRQLLADAHNTILRLQAAVQGLRRDQHHLELARLDATHRAVNADARRRVTDRRASQYREHVTWAVTQVERRRAQPGWKRPADSRLLDGLLVELQAAGRRSPRPVEPDRGSVA
jgi:hypothetical protein